MKWVLEFNHIQLYCIFYSCYVSCFDALTVVLPHLLGFLAEVQIESLIAKVLIFVCTICPVTNISFNGFSCVDAAFLCHRPLCQGHMRPVSHLPLWLPLSQFEGEKQRRVGWVFLNDGKRKRGGGRGRRERESRVADNPSVPPSQSSHFKPTINPEL